MAKAFLSVYDKTGILEFGKELVSLGFELISSGGTARVLRENGLPVTTVSELTGFPEILDGRVKTLQPSIHAGILAKRGNKSHMEELSRLKIQPIDVVAVNLYPFEATISKPGVTLEEAEEQIDIGGPALVRAAAKNWRDVVVVVRPERYADVISALKEGEVSSRLRFQLAIEAFEHTAQYDALIAEYLRRQTGSEHIEFPETVTLRMSKLQELRYGENPHQRAAFYSCAFAPQPSLVSARQISGKELSYNNIADADAALRLALELQRPAAVGVKHGNPCGVGQAASLAEAYSKAYECDPVSIYGGIVALNRVVDAETAKKLSSTFLEVVLAPGYEDEALDILLRKRDLRILELPGWPVMEDGDITASCRAACYDGPVFTGLQSAERERLMEVKSVRGGFLIQESDEFISDPREWRVVTKRQPSPEEWKDLVFAWIVVKHVKSNAIVVAVNEATVGIGGGQTSRIDAARQAVARAAHRCTGSVLASDAFFPFPDVVELAVQAGVKAIVQPGGSIRDDDSIAAANKGNIAMVFTGVRHFRH